MNDSKKIPVTLENLHELIKKIPSEQFEKDRKKINQKLKESKKFWEDAKQK